MSQTMLEVEWRPPTNCTECRVGTLTVPCGASDVRRLPVSWYEGGHGSHSQHYSDTYPPERRYVAGVVHGLGPVPCPVMLIGEAPGQQEDRVGQPFIIDAPAGRVLAGAMAEVGLERFPAGWMVHLNANDWLANRHRAFVFMTNSLKCRPEANKIDRVPDALEYCRSQYLMPELEAVQPKVVVCLGKVAAMPWFGGQPSLAFRQLADDQPLFIHAPHPSHIARGNRAARANLVEALRIAKKVGYTANAV